MTIGDVVFHREYRRGIVNDVDYTKKIAFVHFYNDLYYQFIDVPMSTLNILEKSYKIDIKQLHRSLVKYKGAIIDWNDFLDYSKNKERSWSDIIGSSVSHPFYGKGEVVSLEENSGLFESLFVKFFNITLTGV